MHWGVDFAAPLGTPIFAAEAGEVIEGSERQYVAGFGGWVWLRHRINGHVVATIYGHMYQRDILVKKGDRVKRGQQIARVGNNGKSTGPHLHAEVWFGGRLHGTAVDPMFWYADVPGWSS